MTNYWNNHAKLWNLIGSPLRPNHEDIAILKHYIESLDLQSKKSKCLLLGVTPEIVHLLQKLHMDFYAVDFSAEMVLTLRDNHLSSQYIIGDWLNMPFINASFDLIIGDGCFTAVGNSNNIKKLLNESFRLLKKNGVLINRWFTAPDTQENIQDVLNTPENNFHAFKWRMAMSLQYNFTQGVVLDALWKIFEENKNELLNKKKWQHLEFSTIDSYKSIFTSYAFPSIAELRNLVSDNFDIDDIKHASYHLHERCPIILLKKKN